MTINYFALTEAGLVPQNVESKSYPGGERYMVATNGIEVGGPQVALLRGADPQDIIDLAVWDNYFDGGFQKILLLPYLPGARSDRGRPEGAWVYAKLFNEMDLDEIVTLDPHSERMPSHLYNLKVLPIQKYMRKLLPHQDGVLPYRGIIAPDKGSHARAEAAGAELELEVFYAGKSRDFATGKLSGFEAPEGWNALREGDGRFLIVDDICDGGGTFIGLASVLRLAPERLDLWVTHGIFSRGYDDLRNSFGTIYTTDSHPGVDKSWYLPNPHDVIVRETLPIFNQYLMNEGHN
jgi:ribose-phosphate pyrophosphokinase